MNPKFAKLSKAILFNSPFRKYIFPTYTSKFTPPQLCFLCKCIADTQHIEGAIAEIGCGNGCTTVFLNKYMDAQKIDKAYYGIDTFSGIVSDDIRFEVTNRGKTKELFTGFQANKKKWFDETMRRNKITRIQSVEADVNKFDLTTIGSLSFALIDVGLYRPIKKALPELYKILSPGGIIIVDDCDPTDTHWDGADQAYKEFMKELGLDTQIIYGKLGIIKKVT